LLTVRRGRPRSGAALAELASAGAIEEVSDGIYRVTARGYEIADNDGADERDRLSSTSVFNEHQNACCELIGSVHYMQRDLLRFLLLQGGSARIDVVSRAATNQAPVDISVYLCR